VLAIEHYVLAIEHYVLAIEHYVLAIEHVETITFILMTYYDFSKTICYFN